MGTFALFYGNICFVLWELSSVLWELCSVLWEHLLCFMGTFALFYGNICFVFEHIRGLCLRYQLCFNRSQQSSSLSLSGLLV